MENQQPSALLPVTSSPLPTPLSLLEARPLNCSFSDSGSQLDEDRCYLMEIEQLKRENNFLKKKITELTMRTPALKAPKKRSSLPAHLKPPSKLTDQPPSNYLVAFFEEVTRLVHSCAALFRLGEGAGEEAVGAGVDGELNQLTRDRSVEVQRRLGRLLLEPEERRFAELLDTFEKYYRETKAREEALRGKVEAMSAAAIELGRRVTEQAMQRERGRGSRIASCMSMSVLQESEQSPSDAGSMKDSMIKSTCTDSPQALDLSGCRLLLEKDKFFLNVF